MYFLGMMIAIAGDLFFVAGVCAVSHVLFLIIETSVED